MSASPAARSSRWRPACPASEARQTLERAKGRAGDARARRHPRACLRQRARYGRAYRPFLPAERRHDIVRRRQYGLGGLRRATPGARPVDVRSPRVRAFVNLSADRHHRRRPRDRRAAPFPLRRPGGLRPHDHRKSGPRDRRQTAVWAGAGVGILERAGQARAQGRGHGGRRADDDAHHRLADPAAPNWIEPMKPGDIVTHCYHGRANGIMGQEKSSSC